MQEHTEDPSVHQDRCKVCIAIDDTLRAVRDSSTPDTLLCFLAAAGQLDTDKARDALAHDAVAVLEGVRNDINHALEVLRQVFEGRLSGQEATERLYEKLGGRGVNPVFEIAGPVAELLTSETTPERLDALAERTYTVRSWAHAKLEVTDHDEERVGEGTQLAIEAAVSDARKPGAVQGLCSKLRGVRHG